MPSGKTLFCGWPQIAPHPSSQPLRLAAGHGETPHELCDARSRSILVSGAESRKSSRQLRSIGTRVEPYAGTKSMSTKNRFQDGKIRGQPRFSSGFRDAVPVRVPRWFRILEFGFAPYAALRAAAQALRGFSKQGNAGACAPRNCTESVHSPGPPVAFGFHKVNRAGMWRAARSISGKQAWPAEPKNLAPESAVRNQRTTGGPSTARTSSPFHPARRCGM
jgi:hypothetical protein